MIAHEARLSTLAQDADTFDRYLGEPIAARLFVGHDAHLSPRVRAALRNRGAGLTLRTLDLTDIEHQRAWAGVSDTLLAAALPFGAAQCLTVIPAPGSDAEVCGIPTIESPTTAVPVAENVCTDGLRLGSAESASGEVRDVRIAVEELLLHAQVIGSTGTGKSSLLAGLVGEAQAAGLGVSVIDPHGHLVERIIAETPAGRVASVVGVRHGDPDRPIPVNPFAGRNPEMMSGVLVEVLRELHDPRNQGFMGPVWEQWLGGFMALQRALIGPRANLALLPEMAADQKRLGRLVMEISELHPEAAEKMQNIVSRRPEDYAESASWFVSKFERMINSPELRGILGSGRDAVDVTEVIDRQQVLLIDLAAPILGGLGAQLVGEMWLAKHWEALAQRADPQRPHLLIVDEAHLFASGLLPRLLTQARKFGVAVVLAHQNLEQLTPGLREAVLASTNNVIVFRTGLQEAAAAHERLGTWSGGPLTRLPRLTAATTLSTGAGLTDAFTLRVDHNDRAPAAAPAQVEEVVARTKEQFGLADSAPLSFRSLQEAAGRQRHERKARTEQQRVASRLDEWLATRDAQRAEMVGSRTDQGTAP